MAKNARKILLASSLVGVSILGCAVFCSSNFPVFAENGLLNGFSNAEEWHHYQKVAATSESKGIREYWIRCGGGVRF